MLRATLCLLELNCLTWIALCCRRGDEKTSTLVHFELPCSCRVGLFYVVGLFIMVGLLVGAVVAVARALLDAETGADGQF